jgi:hypothetical protein
MGLDSDRAGSLIRKTLASDQKKYVADTDTVFGGP